MWILACADLHGYEHVYAWLAGVAASRRPDAIVLAGDLFGFPDPYPTVEEAQEAEGRRAARILAATGLPVLYVMGNDDHIDWAPAADTIRPVHGRRVEMGDVNFVGYEFTPPFLGGIHEKPEAEMRADLEALGPLFDDHTVFVTHGPARHALDPAIAGEWPGDCALSDFLEGRRFLAHIHGHVHRAFGRIGRHFNVAAAASRRAMIIDLGTLRHEVVTG